MQLAEKAPGEVGFQACLLMLTCHTRGNIACTDVVRAERWSPGLTLRLNAATCQTECMLLCCLQDSCGCAAGGLIRGPELPVYTSYIAAGYCGWVSTTSAFRLAPLLFAI